MVVRLLLASVISLVAVTPAPAQQPRVEVPGRQVVESGGYLAEVTYASDRVRVRLFDLEGEPVDLSQLWLRRCQLDITAEGGGGVRSRSARPQLVTPRDGSLPYLEARHQLGALHLQDRVDVALRTKNLGGRGDRTVWFEAGWVRLERDPCRVTPGVACRRSGDRDCSLCARRLCRDPAGR